MSSLCDKCYSYYLLFIVIISCRAGGWGRGGSQRREDSLRGQVGTRLAHSYLHVCSLPAPRCDSWLSCGTSPSPHRGPCRVGREAGSSDGGFLGMRPSVFPLPYDLWSVGSRRSGIRFPPRVTGFYCLPHGNNHLRRIYCVPAEAQIRGDLLTVTQRAGICSHVNHLVLLSFG